MKLGTGRYAELLGRLLGQSGVLEVASDLSPEISPVLVLESDRPEWAFLSNQRLVSVFGGMAAVAAQTSIFRLINPAGSNVLATIQRGTLVPAATAQATLFVGGAVADLTTAGVPVFRDSRSGFVGGAALRASFDNNVAASGFGIERQNALGNAPIFFQCFPIILAPGSHVDITIDTVNVAGPVAVHWREREIGKYEQR